MYRVVLGYVVSDAYQPGEAQNTALPCGESVTGHWSRDRRHAENLIRALEESIEQQFKEEDKLW